jgi:hypothetical protein
VKAFRSGNQVHCASCDAKLAPILPIDGGPRVAFEPGWRFDEPSNTWKMGRHAKDRIRQGKRPAFRRMARSVSWGVPRGTVPYKPVPKEALRGGLYFEAISLIPARVEQVACWRCDEVQELDAILLGVGGG